jgi:hypothetical protein
MDYSHPFGSHIWAKNESVEPRLSIWVEPTFFYFSIRTDVFEYAVSVLIGPLEMP